MAYKINQRVENIFAHAAGLHQSGRLKSTIYCIEDRVYVLNQDLTVLLKFGLRRSDVMFKSPISFNANDYESNHFREREGKIEFITESENYRRVKSCKTPGRTPADVEKLFRSYYRNVKRDNKITITDEIISLLAPELSHIEFSAESGKLKIIQRNIYTGSVITITEKERKGLLASDTKLKDFEPIGIRTPDFLSLYAFITRLDWYFGDGIAMVENRDPKMPMIGIISQCVYDELGREE